MKTLLFASLFATGMSAASPSLPIVELEPAITVAGDSTDGGKKKKKDEEKEEDYAYFLKRSAFSTTSAPAATLTVTFLFTPS